MASPLHEVCCASIPLAGLPALAGLRCDSRVKVTVTGERAWLYFPAGDESVLRCILPLSQVQWYERRGGSWYHPGRHLPVFGVPDGSAGQRLDRVLIPSPIEPVMAKETRVGICRLALVRESRM